LHYQNKIIFRENYETNGADLILKKTWIASGLINVRGHLKWSAPIRHILAFSEYESIFSSATK
jgi:hypothetical protein